MLVLCDCVMLEKKREGGTTGVIVLFLDPEKESQGL